MCVQMCALCKRIDIDGNWKPLEEAIKKKRLFLREPFPRLTQSICDACEVELAKLA